MVMQDDLISVTGTMTHQLFIMIFTHHPKSDLLIDVCSITVCLRLIKDASKEILQHAAKVSIKHHFFFELFDHVRDPLFTIVRKVDWVAGMIP